MTAYISELHYDGPKNSDFFEIAVPTGTDVSGYTLEFYDSGGDNYNTKALGSPVTTEYGHNVYLIDNSVAFFPDSRDGHGVALVDDLGTVIQFVSYGSTPSTINAANGPAAGQTSTYIGNAPNGSSLETTDGGLSYQTQANENPGTIPCFAAGTLILTSQGQQPIETLREGDSVVTLDRGARPIQWMHVTEWQRGDQSTDGVPVLIARGALGPDRPAEDLIVSGQHRILVGGAAQLEDLFARECLVPAKSLTQIRGIRQMRGKTRMTWLHFTCDGHDVVMANGGATETMLLGVTALAGLHRTQRLRLAGIFGKAQETGQPLNAPSARACLTVSETRRMIARRAVVPAMASARPAAPFAVSGAPGRAPRA